MEIMKTYLSAGVASSKQVALPIRVSAARGILSHPALLIALTAGAAVCPPDITSATATVWFNALMQSSYFKRASQAQRRILLPIPVARFCPPLPLPFPSLWLCAARPALSPADLALQPCGSAKSHADKRMNALSRESPASGRSHRHGANNVPSSCQEIRRQPWPRSKASSIFLRAEASLSVFILHLLAAQG